MAFAFDLEDAIDKIAELELAIATPSPGIVTAYGYGDNPAEITDPALLPAVVHLPLGPQTVGGTDDAPGRFTMSRHTLAYDIVSLAFISEAVPDIYPADEAAASLFWKPIAETFFNKTNIAALVTASGAAQYHCYFDEQSYQLRAWPPTPADAIHFYYSYRYVHRFIFAES